MKITLWTCYLVTFYIYGDIRPCCLIGTVVNKISCISMFKLLLLELSVLVNTSFVHSGTTRFKCHCLLLVETVKRKNFAKLLESIFARAPCVVFVCYFSGCYKVKCDWLIRADVTEINLLLWFADIIFGGTN